MINRYRDFVFVISLFLFGCGQREAIVATYADESKFPLCFTSSDAVLDKDEIGFTFQLRANTSGDTLLLLAMFDNSSDDTLTLAVNDLQLITSGGLRADVIACDTSTVIVLPAQKKSERFYFHPVNDLMMYNCTGYSGDLDSAYRISYHYVHSNNIREIPGEQITFLLPKPLRAHYLATFAREPKMTLFQFRNPDKLKNTLQERFRNGETNSATVQISNNNFLIAGTLVSLNFYSVDSLLYLRARIVNHGERAFVIDPETFVVQSHNKRFAPMSISATGSGVIQGNGQYLVSGGGRLELQGTFHTNTSEGFSLSMENAIRVHNSNQNLFTNLIEFTAL